MNHEQEDINNVINYDVGYELGYKQALLDLKEIVFDSINKFIKLTEK